MTPVDGSSAGHEIFPHDADAGIRCWGPTAEAAFEQGAEAMFSLMVDLGTVRPTRSVPVTCEAAELELLFVEWLNALVLAKDVERMMFCAFTVRIRGGRLEAEARGEPWARGRHAYRTEVKGATYTELRSEVRDGRVMVQCVVDV